MMTVKLPLILPVETHVRELDGKLLLAAVAAERGHEVYLGSQNEIRSKIAHLPPGHFIAKGFASRKAKFLSILKQLGFNILAWDEEGLVHPEPEIYYKRRISPESLAYLNGVFSWGPDYTQLFSSIPFYDKTPIFETGNPRLDLLDRRVRGYFEAQAKELVREHGHYILLNSNFGRVNSAVKRRRDEGVAGKLTNPVLDEKWQAMVKYRGELYKHFRTMFLALCEAFPNQAVILRPHPAERIESWQDIPKRYNNAKVIYEGNVIPWLLGAEILVHNGCTTALESTLLEKPAIAYRPIKSELHDWHLPNDVSHQAGDINELIGIIRGHLCGEKILHVTPELRNALSSFVADAGEKLAADQIADVLENFEKSAPASISAFSKMIGQFRASVRAKEKKFRSYRPGDIYQNWHQDKHFPDFSLLEMQSRLQDISRACGRFNKVEVYKPYKKIFVLKLKDN